MFFRIKTLFELGFKLTVHIFDYGRGKQEELARYGKVHYYRRNFSVFQLLSKIPFIVLSRKSTELLENLKGDEDPIWFEGIHTTIFIDHPNLKNRIKFIRTHNIEHEYYQHLAKNSTFPKNIFFSLESNKLKKYEAKLKYADQIFAIKDRDVHHFSKINENSNRLSAFISKDVSEFRETKNYALFHGNLSVIENENAVYWIHSKIKSEINNDFGLIIAGKNPSKNIKRFCSENQLKLIANPNGAEMSELIENARVHVFHSASDSGVKLKLLNALKTCGHLLTTENLIFEEDVESLCVIGRNESDFLEKFRLLKSKTLSKEQFENRKRFFDDYFLNQDKVFRSLLNNH